MFKIMLVCPNSTLGTLSDEMSLKSIVRPSATVVCSTVALSSICIHRGGAPWFPLSTTLTVWVRSHSGFECLVVRPNGAIENLKRCFPSFRSEGR